jgi:hypothetical protein
MRSLIGRAASAAALLVIVSLPARAQDPVRLPGVNVIGTPDKPGPKLLVGIVVDTAGNVIAGAEVTIPDLARRAFTKSDGSFRFDSVRSGQYKMRARKLGFAPQIREFEVDSAGGAAQFQLLPIVTALPAMVTSAGRRGISGYVGDVELRSVADATVRVLGAGLSTKTDTDGAFFLPAEPGRYMVAIAKDSFTTKLVSVTVPKDSGRHVNAWLMPGREVPLGEAWNIEDLRERHAWVRPQDRILYTREDMSGRGIEWVYDAVQLAGPKFGFVERLDRDCMVVADGGPDIVNLATLTIDDVESVEIYKAYPSGSPTVAAAAPRGKNTNMKGGQFVQRDNARRAIIENGARVCPGVFVWLR